MALKPNKTCPICKKKYVQYNSFRQKVCGDTECAIAYVDIQKEKESQKIAKQHKKELRDFRLNDKSIAKLRAEAQTQVNLYIRTRDENKPCISCDSLSKEVDAGHFRSRGSARQHAFNTFNIFSQCKRCNRYLGGNYSEMRKGVIDRIGLERVERLENDNAVRRFDKEYLVRIKKIFAERTRHLKRIRNK